MSTRDVDPAAAVDLMEKIRDARCEIYRLLKRADELGLRDASDSLLSAHSRANDAVCSLHRYLDVPA